VEAHPEWIQDALLAGKMEEKEIFLSSNAAQKTFEGIKDAKQLANAFDAHNELTAYTQDQSNYYRFLIKERAEKKEILTFKEALKSGILTSLVDKMEAKKLAQTVIQACPRMYQEIAYAYRFAPFLASQWNNASLGELAKQFACVKKEKTITRCEKNVVSFDDILALQEGEYSDIKADPVEGAYFFRFIEKRCDTTLPVEKLLQIQALLSKEVRCRYFETCLKKLSP
jgi:hypothetical protein